MEVFTFVALALFVVTGTLSPFVSKYAANRPRNGEAIHLASLRKIVDEIKKKEVEKKLKEIL